MSTLAPGENPLKDAKHRSFRADCEFMSRAHKSNYTVVEITTCEALNKIINQHSCCRIDAGYDSTSDSPTGMFCSTSYLRSR